MQITVKIKKADVECQVMMYNGHAMICLGPGRILIGGIEDTFAVLDEKSEQSFTSLLIDRRHEEALGILQAMKKKQESDRFLIFTPFMSFSDFIHINSLQAEMGRAEGLYEMSRKQL